MYNSKYKKYKKTYKKFQKSTGVNPTVKAYVKKTLNSRIEDKYVDTTLTGGLPSWSYTTNVALNVPGPGTSSQGRIGDKIRPTKVEVYGHYRGSNSHTMRIIFYRWHPQTVPTGGNVLEGAHAGTDLAVIAPYAEQYKPMFTILKDKTYALSSTGAQNALFKFNISRKKLANIEFNSSGDASQRIYYLVIQNGSASLNYVDLHLRLWYEDA